MFELVAALLLVTILSGMAVPSIQRVSANNQIESASDSIASGLNFARSTAIATGDEIMICPSGDGLSCLEDHWHRNWIVFKDRNGDSSPDPDEVLKTGTLERPVTANGFGQAIIFRPSGATSLDSDVVITNCHLRSEITAKCMGITIRALGAIESAERDSSPEA